MADLELDFEPPLARLRFNAPERRNAMTRAMWRAPRRAPAPRSRRAPTSRVVLVEGAGGHFCAGADISEFDDGLSRRRGDARLSRRDRGGAYARCRARSADDRRDRGLGDRRRARGRAELRPAVLPPRTRISPSPPAKLGLLYGPVETRRLVELVGPARAKDLLFSGRRVATGEALAIGLDRPRLPGGGAARRAPRLRERPRRPQPDLDPRREAMVDALAAGAGAGHAASRAVEAAALGEDFREGRAAFAAKRPPRFAFRGATKPIASA